VITSLNAPEFCAKSALVIDRARLATAASLTLYRQGDRFVEVEARAAGNWKPWYGRPEVAVAPAARRQSVAPVPISPVEPPAETTDDGSDMILP
jgi:hypothetical protein